MGHGGEGPYRLIFHMNLVVAVPAPEDLATAWRNNLATTAIMAAPLRVTSPRSIAAWLPLPLMILAATKCNMPGASRFRCRTPSRPVHSASGGGLRLPRSPRQMPVMRSSHRRQSDPWHGRPQVLQPCSALRRPCSPIPLPTRSAEHVIHINSRSGDTLVATFLDGAALHTDQHVSKAEGGDCCPPWLQNQAVRQPASLFSWPARYTKQRRMKCRSQGAEVVVSHCHAKQHDGRLRSPWAGALAASQLVRHRYRPGQWLSPECCQLLAHDPRARPQRRPAVP